MNGVTVEILEQGKVLMAQVAEKIGESAAWGFEITMQRVIAEGVLGVVLGTLAIIILSAVLYKLWDWAVTEEEEEITFLASILTMLTMVGLGLSVFWVYSSGLQLIAPEYATIEKMVELVKPNPVR